MGQTATKEELKQALLSAGLLLQFTVPLQKNIDSVFLPYLEIQQSLACCFVTSEFAKIVANSKVLNNVGARNLLDSPYLQPGKEVAVVPIFRDRPVKRNCEIFLPLPQLEGWNSASHRGSNVVSLDEYIRELNKDNNSLRPPRSSSTDLHARVVTSLNDHSYSSFLDMLLYLQKKLYPQCTIIVNNPSYDSLLSREALTSNVMGDEEQRMQQHPNLMKLIAILENPFGVFLIFPYYHFSLSDFLTFNTKFISMENTKGLFIVYQLLHLLDHLHNTGIVHGNINMNSIFIDENLWIHVPGPQCSPLVPKKTLPLIGIEFSIPPSIPFSLVSEWINGRISNFNYLLTINHLAGRRSGDPSFHPALPWVVDFSNDENIYENMRDFTKTKFRMNKGDQQLDITYSGATPHHIIDILTDITYYVYMARLTPIPILRQHVRAKYEPQEYPASMRRLYQWTPDECIPEFYTDPSIFKSMHPDMPDLALPGWAKSPEHFVQQHMEVLESDYVSSQLHHWIDLNFGYLLTGEAAVKAKNVALSLTEVSTSLNFRHGIVQLFNTPHPRRFSLSNEEDENEDDELTGKNYTGRDVTLSSSLGTRSNSGSVSDKQFVDKMVNLFGILSPGNDESKKSVSSSNKGISSAVAQTAAGGGGGGNAPTSKYTPLLENSTSFANEGLFTPLVDFPTIDSSTSFPPSSRNGIRKDANKMIAHGAYGIGKPDISFELPTINLISSLVGSSKHDGLSATTTSTTIFKEEWSYLERNGIGGGLGAIAGGNQWGGAKYSCIPSSTPGVSSIPISAFTISHLESSSSYNPESFPLSTSNVLGISNMNSPLITISGSSGGGAGSGVGGGSGSGGIGGAIGGSGSSGSGGGVSGSSGVGSASTVGGVGAVVGISRRAYNPDVTGNMPVPFTVIRRNEEIRIPAILPANSLRQPVDFLEQRQAFEKKHPFMSFSGVDDSLAGVDLFGAEYFAMCKSFDMKGFGQLMLSIFSKDKPYSQLEIGFDSHRILILRQLSFAQSIRNSMRTVIHQLLHEDWKARPEASFLLESYKGASPYCLPSICFPSYFPKLYKFLTKFTQQVDWHSKLSLTKNWMEELCALDDEGFEIVLPAITQLFQQPELHLKVLDLLSTLGNRLGRLKLNLYFRKPILGMFEISVDKENKLELFRKLLSNTMMDQIILQFGLLETLTSLLPHIIDALNVPNTDETRDSLNLDEEIAKLACSCLLYLSTLLGPILTSKFITIPLFRKIVLDNQSSKLLHHALISIGGHFGDTFIVVHYFPHLLSVVEKYRSKPIQRTPVIICNVLTLMEKLIMHVESSTLTNSVLTSELSEMFERLLSPLPENVKLPLEGRKAICRKAIETLLYISHSISRNVWERFVVPVLRQFFAAFDDVFLIPHNDGESDMTAISTNSDLTVIYSPDMAYFAYSQFCQLIGQETMRRFISNSDLIEKIMYDHLTSNDSNSSKSTSTATIPLSSRPRRTSDDIRDSLSATNLSTSKTTTTPKSGISAPFWKSKANTSKDDFSNWVSYFQEHADDSRPRNQVNFQFKELKLRSFSGHSGTVRNIAVHEHETFFASGGKDRTVKLWSLDIYKQLSSSSKLLGGGSDVASSNNPISSAFGLGGSSSAASGINSNSFGECLRTYNGHRKPILDICFVDHGRTIASCDGQLHFWHHESERTLFQYDFGKNLVTTITNMNSLNLVAAATLSSSLIFFDGRTSHRSHDWRTTTLISEKAPKVVTVEPTLNNLIAVGFSSGYISVLDSRTGLLISQWRAHDSEVTMLKFHSTKYLISACNNEPLVSVWDLDTATLTGCKNMKNWKGPSDMSCLTVSGDSILTVGNGNWFSPQSFNLSTTLNVGPDINPTKLKNQHIKSQISSLALLPLHQLFLFGTEDGQVFLYS